MVMRQLSFLFRKKRTRITEPFDTSIQEDLKDIWLRLRHEYFPEQTEIDNYDVKWSDRNQKSLLASCNIAKAKVKVAKALDHYSCKEIIEPLLFHEMCHAALGEPKVVRGRRIMHGRDFKALERKHPKIPLLNAWIRDGFWDKAVRRYRRQKSN